MKQMFSPLYSLLRLAAALAVCLLHPVRRACAPRFPVLADPLARGDVYGTQATKTQSNPPKKIDVRDFGARIRYINEVYTQGAADGEVGDVIHLPTPPVGAKIVAHLCQVTNSAGNANATIQLGTTTDDDALLGATAIADAGTRAGTPPANGADDVTIAEGDELIATNATAAIKAEQVIRFRIAYVEMS